MGSVQMQRKVLVVGLDAAEPQLLREWAAAGELPHVAGLLAGGAARVVNAPGLYEGAVWPSFATGLDPSGHGRTCFRRFDPRTYRDRDVSPLDVAGAPFWVTAARAGLAAVVFDVPKSAPSAEANLRQVCDWGTHDHDFARPRGSPPGLAAEVGRRFGADPVGSCDVPRHGAAAYANFVVGLAGRARLRGEIASWLLADDAWHLAIVVFSESHCVGHQCWHLHEIRSDSPAAIEDPVRRVYRAIDAEVGRLLHHAGEDTDVLLFASHGMGPHRSGNHLLDAVLRHLDDGAPVATGDRGASWLRTVWRRLPAPLSAALDPLRRAVRTPLESALLAPGRRRRRFFAVPNNEVCGGVRLNLEGREAAGQVGSHQAATLIGRLRDELLALVHDDGSPAVADVVVAAQRFTGPHTAVLPDLLVVWNPARPITALRLRDGTTVRGGRQGFRSGDHRPDGLLAARPATRGALVLPEALDVTELHDLILGRLGVQPAERHTGGGNSRSPQRSSYRS